MADKPKTEPRKKPSQRRARDTVRALVEATARVLVDEGIEALSTNRIAEVAGVSVGSLYQYFPTKEALIAAVIDRRLEEDRAQAQALLRADAPLAERVEQLVRWLVARQAAAAPLMAKLLPLLDELDREALARRLVNALVSELRALLMTTDAARPDLGDPERLEIALFVVSRTLRWVTNAAVTEDPELLQREEFADELVRITRGLFRSK